MIVHRMFHAEIEATNHCNTRCLHCPHETITRPKGEMSWETFTTIAGKIREHQQGERFSLSFSGMGEPLLNPELFRFIEHVAAEATTSFASNGALLSEKNVTRLIAAGLDAVYVSFNGDEKGVFEKMMGRVRFEQALRHTRRAVELAKGTRLQIRANISVAKANQDRLTKTRALLEQIGVGPVSVSLCHSRGGNLKDASVCDTPPMGAASWDCDVLQHTLFVDWRGRAFICDHDLHGEYPLGDLMREPLATILERRRKLIEVGVSFKICRECNDIMRVGNATPLESGEGGIFREWIHRLYQDEPESLAHATPPMKWIYRIYDKERRVDRLVDELLAIEQSLQRQLVKKDRALAAAKRELAEFPGSRAGRIAAVIADAWDWVLRPASRSGKREAAKARQLL